MALVPVQERSVDPYSENRFSSVINRFTRMVTNGENIIMFPDKSFKLRWIDSTTISIGAGICIKDDVMIHIKEDYELDFTNNEFYVDSSGSLQEEGTYYIVLSYMYQRSLPSPQAYYKIIRDVDTIYRPYINRYIFLGAVTVEWNDILSRFELREDSVTTILDVSAVYISDNYAPFNIDSSTNILHIRFEDASSSIERTISLTIGNPRSAQQICNEINAAFAPYIVAVPYQNRIKLISPYTGTDSKIFMFNNSTAAPPIGFPTEDALPLSIGGTYTRIREIEGDWGTVDGGVI